MNPILKFVIRNLNRNKRRTILAATSVAISSMLVVVLLGLVDGMVENMIKNSTKNETGHVRIVSKEYLKNISSPDIRYLIYEAEEIIEKISNDKDLSKKIETITQRIKFPVLLQIKSKNKTALCISADKEKERQLLMLDKSIVEGRYLTGERILIKGKKYYEVILGKKLAEILELKVGDTFTIMIQGTDLSLHIPSFYVRGIFNTGLNMIDENIIMMNIEDAKKILKTNGGVQEIFIMLKNYKEAQEFTKKVNKILIDNNYNYLIAVDWKSSGNFLRMIEQALQVYNLLYLMITVLGALIITNIMMMVVLERRYEIGILKSMGFKNIQILGLFTLEGALIGTIGVFVGVFIGTLINIPLSIYGIDFSSSMNNLNFPLESIIKWKINIFSIIFAMILGMVISAVMSLIPSRYASKLKIVDAIRSV